MHARNPWRVRLAVLAAAALLGACMERPALVGDATGQAPGAEQLVTVIGTGRIEMPPESASFDGVITTVTPSPAEGWTAGSAVLGRVLRALESAGVGSPDLSMGALDLTQRDDGNWTLVQRLRVSVHDLGRLPELMSVASSAGAHRVEVHRFGIADERAAGDRARERALLDARRKAEMLSQEHLLRLVEVRSIEELPVGTPATEPDSGVYETVSALRVTYVMGP